MINVSTKCKRLIYSGERVYIVDATIELSNGTVLEPSNSQIMSDGLELDDAVGSDDDFNCIGSTIVNGCNLILYNNDRVFSDYDFINAVVTIEIKIDISDTDTPNYETISKGVFTVDEATWGDGIVTLVLLDNMCQFDRPYTSHNIYTATTTIYDVVLDACTKCGVTIAGTMTNMPNKNFVVAGPPKDDTTYREVIGWCAAIAGCFARCTTDGKLEFAWFDVDKFTADTGTDGGIFDEGTPYYTSGDTALGGTFNPWNDQYNVDGGLFTDRSGIHHISALTSQNIGVDDVVITDVQIAYDVETANSSETNYYPATIADNRYVISIDAIPFINEDNVEDFYDILADRLIGLTFRTCNVTQINDPTIEAGDIAWLWDTRGEVHKILITRTTFSITGSQTIICGAKTPARNSATQITAIAKANARSNRRLNEEKSIRQQLADSFNNYVANAKGLYLSKVTDANTGAVTIYGHDKQYLAQSKMVLKISNGAISMTADYRGTDAATSAANAWYGFQFDGTWLANIISTVNLFFNYAHGGTLLLGGSDNENGKITVKDASGTTCGTWTSTGIHVLTGTISGATLTAGGSADGVITVQNASGTQIGRWDKDGILVTQGSISGSVIKGGTLLLGGDGNGNGQIKVQDASGTTVGTWTSTGIHILAGTINVNNVFKVYDTGAMTCTSATITGSITATSGSLSNLSVTGKLLLGTNGCLTTNTNRTTYNDTSNNGITIDKNGIGGYGSSGSFTLRTNGVLTATGADITGKITSTKQDGNDTLKLIIDDSDLRGYENSRLFGKLDLCAQSTDNEPHASLEGTKYLSLEAGTEISIRTGAIGGNGTERMYINNSGVHISNGANISKMAVAVDFDGSGQATSWFLMKVVDGIIMEYY